MKTVKFYYSKPVHVRLAPIFTDVQGRPLYITSSLKETLDEQAHMFLPSSTSVVRKMPRVVVASVYDADTNSMSFGVATCSPKDTFNKEIGRNLAEERARNNPKLKIVGIKRRSAVRQISKKYANQLISEILGFNVQSRF